MSECATVLAQLRQSDSIRSLDWHFGQLLETLAASEPVVLAGVLTSKALSRGDSCLPLGQLLEILAEWSLETSLAQWQQWLQNSAVVGEDKPLVFDGERIYLNRYWQFERALAYRLGVGPLKGAPAPSKVKPVLNKLFDEAGANVDWQRVAAAQACQRQLLVVSGGPGTGKTTTVTRLLALLQQLAIKERGEPLAVALVAPTGKAAARLSESIAGARAKLPESLQQAAEAIPDHASTIHRLLGVIPGRNYFQHNENNPLLLDLLIIDEASMIDLSLMTHLFVAVAAQTRVILLGDRDQLASVEAGSVLADICEFIEQGVSPKLEDYLVRCGAVPANTLTVHTEGAPEICDNLVMLRQSYRFGERSGIGQLARAVNQGDANLALRHLQDKRYEAEISWRDLSAESYGYVLEKTMVAAEAYLSALSQQRPMTEVFQRFSQFQLLVALRQGDFGVEGINTRLQRQLHRRHLLAKPIGWCEGLPVMVTSNDHTQQLYNGDIGIFARDDHGTLMVAFESANSPDGIRWVLPSRLPEHDVVFAMTVHKSQGSEFSEVLLLLPRQGGGNPTRELLYTGITRARNRFALVADEYSVKRACHNQTRRRSGLAARLGQLTNPE